MIRLPAPTQDPNVQALSRLHRESRTGSVLAAWQLTNRPMIDPNNLESSPFFLYKNGLLLQPTTDYTVAGDVVTLAVAPVVGDRVTAIYWYVAQ